jgi:hypothetical protein
MKHQMIIPTPDFTLPQYSHPDKYLLLAPSFVGNSTRVHQVVTTFVPGRPEQQLAQIWRWIRSNMQCDNNPKEYGWRPADEIIARGRYIGCADHALVFGCLTRACSIPTIWVKSMDINWIKRFRMSAQFNGGSGHVFLEVFLENAWVLLDADAANLYEDYDYNGRLLPDERYSYDKGGNPCELVLSLDWEPWVEQTRSFFSTFDLRVLENLPPATKNPPRKLAV